MGAGNNLADIAVAVQILLDSADQAAVRIAAALDQWRRSNTATLEQCLGRATGFRAGERLRQRDGLLIQLAGHFPQLRGRSLARAVHQELIKPREVSRPDGMRGAVYDVIALGDPPSEGHLRRILAEVAETGSSNPESEPVEKSLTWYEDTNEIHCPIGQSAI